MHKSLGRIHEPFLLIDANGRLGSIESEAIGLECGGDNSERRMGA